MSQTQKPEVTLYEDVNLDILRRIIAAEECPERIRDMLKKYHAKLNNSNKIPVTYWFGKKMDADYGRVYAQGALSLQNFDKEIRHALSRGKYIDIDMVNAHPNLLKQYCSKMDIKCPYLDKYVDNREKHLAFIMKTHNIDRGEAKNLFLRFMYHGEYIIGDKMPESLSLFAENFRKEMITISKCIRDIDKELYDKIASDSSNERPLSTLMSITLNNLEHMCLMSMVQFFNNVKIEVGTLCFDGLLLKKGKGEFDEYYLSLCVKHVLAKTGYLIKLEEKPMDLKLSFEIPKFGRYVDNDEHAQRKLFEMEGDNKFKFCAGILYIFDERTGMFADQKVNEFATLTYYLKKNKDYLHKVISTDPKSGREKTESYGSSTALAMKIRPWVISASEDNDWFKDTDCSSIGYMLFKDGIYHFKTGTFKLGFNPDIVFHVRCPHKFPERDESSLRYAMKLSFGRLLEHPERFIAAFSCALAGVHLKHFYFGPGEADAGKSKLIGMFEYVFGDIIGSFNMESLACTSKFDTKEEAQRLRWAACVRYCLIIFSSEANMDLAVNGNYIKKLSGDDRLVGRLNHGNEFSFRPHFTPFCFLNDIPEIKPLDQPVYNRNRYDEFGYVFTDNPTEPHHKPKDHDIDNKFRTEKFVAGFIHILLDGFKTYQQNGFPEFDIAVREKWTKDAKVGSIIKEAFDETFIVTKDKKDMVLVSAINKFFETRKDQFKISKTRYIEMLTKERGLYQSDPIKGNRYWVGLKFKPKDEEDDDLQ
jgi:phage/plasmid-associated DNA primase